MVLHTSMFDWRRGWGMSAMAFSYMWKCFGVWVCHGYMCIVQYVRLMGCNSVAWIYGQLAGGQSVMHICAYCDMWNFLDVSVEWFYGWLGGSICQGYMCILLYVKLIRYNGFAYIYAWLEEVVGYVCHGILLHVKLFWCMGLPWVYVHCAVWDLWGVMVLHGSMVNWKGEGVIV